MMQKTVFSNIGYIESRLKGQCEITLSKNEGHTIGNVVCSFRLVNECASIMDDQKCGSSLP